MAVLRFLFGLGLLGAAGLAWAYMAAMADPVVLRADMKLPGWPAGAPPLTLLFLADLHVAGPDMPPERIERIVAQANALAPDIVLIGGDFVSDKRSATHFYSLAEAIAPLSRLRPRLGTVAVLGNHDHWRDAAETHRALAKAGIRVLDNDAAQVGPLAIGGLDDAFTSHDDLAATLAAMRGLPGARILISHSPDPFAQVPADVPLTLAGHTHCGQIALPLYGPLATFSRYGRRYACGMVREKGKMLIVSAGLGTSILPLRIGAPPDMWLLTLRGPRVPRPGGAR